MAPPRRSWLASGSVRALVLCSALGCSPSGSQSAASSPADSPALDAAPGAEGGSSTGAVALLAGVAALSAANAAGYRFRSVAIGGGGFVSGLIPSRTRPGLWFARTDVGGAYRWDQGLETWTPLTDWVSDEQTGYLGVESIALDPSAPERVYLLVGIAYFHGGKSAVLRSSDFGNSFEVTEVTDQIKVHGNGMGRQSGEKLAVDPNDGRILLAGTRSAGLFRSADRGASWQRLPSLDVTTTANGNGIAFVLFDPAPKSGGSGSDVYVGVSRGDAEHLYVSSDGGQSFRPVAGQPTGFTPQRAALSDSGALFITYGNGPGPHPHQSGPMDRGALWKLDTPSGAWTEVTPLRGSDNRAFGGVSVDASHPERVLASTSNTWLEQPWGNGDRIFLSENGGESWTDLVESQRLEMDENGFPWIQGHSIHWAGSIELDPFDGQRAMVTSGNGVFRTDNLGDSPSVWKFTVQGLEETVPLDAVSLPGGPLVSVIGDYDGFVHTDLTTSPEGGKHEPSMGTTHGLAVAGSNPRILARSGKQLFLSRDGAESWKQLSSPSSEEGGRLALSADGGVLLWSIRSAVHRTDDAGATWTRAQGLDFDAAPAADAVEAQQFYAYDPSSGGFFVSRDGARTFARTASLATGGAPRIRVVPGVAGDVWVPLHGKGLMRSTDGGQTLTVVAGVERCTAIGFGIAADGKGFPAVYMWGAPPGQPSGLYRSDDAGQGWLRINDDAHQYGGPGNGQFVIGDANVYGRVYLSTAGRGLIVGWPER